jgi:hypothetical protein
MLSLKQVRCALVCFLIACFMVVAAPKMSFAGSDDIAILNALSDDGVKVKALNESALAEKRAKVQIHMSQYGGQKIQILDSRGNVLKELIEAAFAPIDVSVAYPAPDSGGDTRISYYGPLDAPSAGTTQASSNPSQNRLLFTFDLILGTIIAGPQAATDRISYFAKGVQSDPGRLISEEAAKQKISIRDGCGIGRLYNSGQYGTIYDPDGYSYGRLPTTDGSNIKKYTVGTQEVIGNNIIWMLNPVNFTRVPR